MRRNWTFFSNYGHIIILLSNSPDMTIRRIAEEVGITERACQKIISDLCEEGYLEISKNGRNNSYKINTSKNLRHPIESAKKVGELIEFIQA